MTCETFGAKVLQGLQDRELGNVSLRLTKQMKSNGQMKYGIVFKNPAANTSPTIYLEEYYEFYQATKDLDTVIDLVAGLYQSLPAIQVDEKKFPNVKMASLFDSHFYLIARHEDPISRSELITEEMLDGRTLLIGGDTPSELSLVHQRLIGRGKVEVLHSYNLNTTLSYIATQKGICIAPGFTNDHNREFAWIPFDCPERIRCVFGYHKNDRTESTRIFIELAQNAYQNTEKGQFL